jgi:hypothetical protein
LGGGGGGDFGGWLELARSTGCRPLNAAMHSSRLVNPADLHALRSAFWLAGDWSD